MPFPNHSTAAEINLLWKRIIEVGYEKGFEQVKNEINRAIRLTFFDPDTDEPSYVEHRLLALNYRRCNRLDDDTIKNIVSETAIAFHEKLQQHEVDLQKCKGKVLNFILAIAANKYRMALRKKVNSKETSLDKILETNKRIPNPFIEEENLSDLDIKRLDIWKQYLAKFSNDEIKLLVLRLLRGISFKSISRILKSLTNTCRQRWTRTRDKVKHIAQQHELLPWKSGLYEAILEIAKDRKIIFPCDSGMIITYEEVKEKLSLLRSRYRFIMYLKYFEELSDEELEKRTGLGINETNKLIKQAKRRLLVLFMRDTEMI